MQRAAWVPCRASSVLLPLGDPCLLTFSTSENYSSWTLLVFCHQQNQKRYSGISSLVCSAIPRDVGLWLGVHWAFIWVSLMLTTPFKEGSEPGYKIMLFPEGEKFPSSVEQDLYFSSAMGLGTFYSLSLFCFHAGLIQISQGCSSSLVRKL